MVNQQKSHKCNLKTWSLFFTCEQLPRIAEFVYTSVWPLFRSWPGLSRPLPFDEVWQQMPRLSQIFTTTRALLAAQLLPAVLVAIFDTCSWPPGKGSHVRNAADELMSWYADGQMSKWEDEQMSRRADASMLIGRGNQIGTMCHSLTLGQNVRKVM